MKKYIGLITVLLLIIGLSCSKPILEETKIDKVDIPSSENNISGNNVEYREPKVGIRPTIVCYSGGKVVYSAILKEPAETVLGRWSFRDTRRRRSVLTNMECIFYGKADVEW